MPFVMQQKNVTLVRMARFSKYNNVRTVVDGITFDSKKEAQRYSELRLRKSEITLQILSASQKSR